MSIRSIDRYDVAVVAFRLWWLFVVVGAAGVGWILGSLPSTAL